MCWVSKSQEDLRKRIELRQLGLQNEEGTSRPNQGTRSATLGLEKLTPHCRVVTDPSA